jgi:hypothetical protein
MLRLVEVALFLAPFALFAVWRVLVPQAGPPRSLVIGAAVVVLVIAASLVWLRQEDAEPANTAYVPSHMENGQILPPSAAPAR